MGPNLDAGAQLRNRVGGPHAAAVPLVKSAGIAYSAVATGPLLATGRLAGDAVSARASLGARGVTVFDVEVAFTREDDDVETATATYSMALERFAPG